MSSNWSKSEDVQLCISFVRQSVDPISGSQQTVGKLWEKIHYDYQQNWVRNEHEVRKYERSQVALQSRFAKLKPLLVYWSSCLAYARRNPESGCNLQDELRKAQVMYVAKKKKTFTHFECWEQVKNHHSFAISETYTPRNTYEASSIVDEVDSTKVLENPTLQETLFSTPEDYQTRSSSPVRPPGVKAVKESKRKGKNIANEVHNQALISIAESKRQSGEQNQIQMERIWKMQQQLLEQNQQKIDREWKMQIYQIQKAEREDNQRIMLMDIDKMTSKSKKFFSKRKAEILHCDDEDDCNDAGSSDEFANCYRPFNFDD